ncbi:MAG: helix-turn-helix transcriptional regulator [Clostridiales bacterium]|nr:helix-turn-helix transcriptional regulator [Clostridiales bacterium]
MDINELLKKKGLTKYQLSKLSGIPFATISDISTGKSRIEKCTAETVYKLARALGTTVEDLLADRLEYRSSFEAYKSNVCHMVKDMGDIDFIIETLESGRIRKLFDRKWYPESLYLLAMVDYLSRENGLPVCADYSDIRAAKLKETIYPASVIAMCSVSHSDQPKNDSLEQAILEFKRVGIVEGEIRNVF